MSWLNPIWYSAGDPPPIIHDPIDARSGDVLVVTTSGNKFTAYWRDYDDREYPGQWIQCGRDGYDMTDYVVAWTPLPSYP